MKLILWWKLFSSLLSFVFVFFFSFGLTISHTLNATRLFVFAKSIWIFSTCSKRMSTGKYKYVCSLLCFSFFPLLEVAPASSRSSSNAYELLYLQFTSTYTTKYTLLTLCWLWTFVLVVWHSASLCISIDLVQNYIHSNEILSNLKYFTWNISMKN